MITPAEYRAEVFKIAGFALMSPFGKFFLNIPEIKLEDLSFQFLVNFIISFFLFCCGIILIQRGYEITIDSN